MAKKKGADKKGKGDKDKKSGLTNLEREIYVQAVAELKHKIAWRNHLCSLIDEDAKQLREKYEIQKRDKLEAMNILQEAIEDERKMSEKIHRSIPDAENWKIQIQESRARDLAAKLKKIQQDKLSDNRQLDVLRKKLKSLTKYREDDVGIKLESAKNELEELDQKIRDIGKELDEEDHEETFLKRVEQEKRREEAFRREMQDILEDEAESIQAELSGQLNANFERITEETRWWADQANGLRIATERLETINDAKLASFTDSKRELEERKEAAVQSIHRLQERDFYISELEAKNRELEDQRRVDAERDEMFSKLEKVSKNVRLKLDEEEDNLMRSFDLVKENEDRIKLLEEKLENEVAFGRGLRDYIEKAQQLLMEEAKQCLLLTYNGIPKKKNTLAELRKVFEEATAYVHSRGNRSLY